LELAVTILPAVYAVLIAHAVVAIVARAQTTVPLLLGATELATKLAVCCSKPGLEPPDVGEPGLTLEAPKAGVEKVKVASGVLPDRPVSLFTGCVPE
jgi:hypothetical protein